jgi:amidase
MLCYRILTDEPAQDEPHAQRPRIYCSNSIGSQPVDDEVSGLLATRLSALSEQDVDLVTVDSPGATGGLTWTYIKLSMFEFAPRENNRMFHFFFWCSERLRSLFRGGLRSSYAALKAEQKSRSGEMARFMEGCDGWILPATPTVAFRHRKRGTPIPLTARGRTQECAYFAASQGHAYPFNLLGNPCLVVPLGRNKEGLPVAAQVVGKPGQDMKLLSVASLLAAKLAGDTRQFDRSVLG